MGDTKFKQTGRRTAQGPYRADERRRRQDEGEVRNQLWQELSKAEKIASLRARRGESKRQMKRLEA